MSMKLFRITTFSIMALSIMEWILTLSISDTQYNSAEHIVFWVWHFVCSIRCHLAHCLLLNVIMLDGFNQNVILLNAVMLSVLILNFVMPSAIILDAVLLNAICWEWLFRMLLCGMSRYQVLWRHLITFTT